MKENASGCFFSEHSVYTGHQLTVFNGPSSSFAT